MTHADIYEKFMIEYDKANTTSSYPSLTKYEIATLLDKSYLALLAQKVTGNNSRKVGFETDVKSIHDLQALIESSALKLIDTFKYGSNQKDFALDLKPSGEKIYPLYLIDIFAKNESKRFNVLLISHKSALNFMITDTNYPWIKQPVCYVGGDQIHVLYDPDKPILTLNITYIKKPYLFVRALNEKKDVNFELTDNMAEELINLAIVFATETTQSPRVLTKTSLLSLES